MYFLYNYLKTADQTHKPVSRSLVRAGSNANRNDNSCSSGDGSVGNGIAVVRPLTDSNYADDNAAAMSLNSTAIPVTPMMQTFKPKQLKRATSKVKKKRKRLSFDDATAAIAANRSGTNNNSSSNKIFDNSTPSLVMNNYMRAESAIPPLSLSMPSTYSTIIKQQHERDKRDKNAPRKLSLPASLSLYAPMVVPPTSKTTKQHFNGKTESGLSFCIPTTSNSSKSNRKLAKLLKARLSMANAYSPHAKCRKSSAASIVETALAAAGVNVNLTNASISSASATELLTAIVNNDTDTKATGDYFTETFLPPSASTAGNENNYSSSSSFHNYQRHLRLMPDNSSECGMTDAAPPGPPLWYSGVNFLTYMVCSLCCCCYNLRNKNDNNR